MKKIVSIVACMAVAVMFSGVVIAADETGKKHGEGKKRGERFEQADVNKDGKLSLDEFKTMCKAKDPDAVFKKLDTDSDGFVTKAEMKAGRKACKKCVKPAATTPAPVPAPVPAPAPAPAPAK